jgi:hypothetical protein
VPFLFFYNGFTHTQYTNDETIHERRDDDDSNLQGIHNTIPTPITCHDTQGFMSSWVHR